MAITNPHTPPRDTTPEDSIIQDEKHNPQDHADTSHLDTLDHTRTNQTQKTTFSKTDDLEKVETFDIDPKNKKALKGDESDGKIDWTTKQLIATISLAMIYTGTSSPVQQILLRRKLTSFRLPNPPLLRRRLPNLHRSLHRSRFSNVLAPRLQHAGYRRNLPLRGLHQRSLRAAKHNHRRMLRHHRRHNPRGHSTQFRSGRSRHDVGWNRCGNMRTDCDSWNE